jgi:hypothetical protein
MDRIEEIIKEFALSAGEVELLREELHKPEFRTRLFERYEPYAEVFYDVCLRYVESGIYDKRD